MSSDITEINKDTFWTLIAQAKEHPGGPSEWLMERLVDMGPEQAKRFDDIAHAYMDAADQYSLWTAASVMERGGCTDDGFIDFRTWLVAQGRDVYMAALKDPNSLVDAPDYNDCLFDSLPHMGDSAYEELTGQSTYQDFDPAQYHALKEELKKDIVYGEGIGYLHWPDDPQMETAIRDKVRSAHVTVEANGATLYAKLELEMTADLTIAEFEAFTKQVDCQYRDGWGAEFELITIPTSDAPIYLRLWHDDIAFFTGAVKSRFLEQRRQERAAPQTGIRNRTAPAAKSAAKTKNGRSDEEAGRAEAGEAEPLPEPVLTLPTRGLETAVRHPLRAEDGRCVPRGLPNV